MKNLVLIALITCVFVGCAETAQPEIISDRQKAQVEVTNISLKQLISKMNFEEEFMGQFTNDEYEMNNLINQDNFYMKACTENKLRDVNLSMYDIKILKDNDMNKYIVVLTDKENPKYKRYFHESKLTCELSGRGRDFVLKKMEEQKYYAEKARKSR